MDFTLSQKEAIELEKDNILVCAAAGSGKTTVLCNRIVKRVLEGKCDLSKILVVTFTVAAAEDLKRKLKKSLNSAVINSSEDTKKIVYDQLNKLPYAKISTIHSFALEIIRTNFDKLKFPAKIRVADDFESNQLAEREMNKVIEEMYKNDNGSFASFTDAIVRDRDDKLCEYFLSIYKTLSNLPRGISLIDDCSQELSKGISGEIFSTPYGKQLYDGAKLCLDFVIPIFQRAVDSYYEAGLGANKNCQCFENALSTARELAVSLDQGCNYFMHALKGVSYPRFTNAKKIDDHNRYKEIFDYFRKMTENNGERLGFIFSYDTVNEDVLKTSEHLTVLYKLLEHFENNFREEKRKRGVVDFVDIERMTHSLLWNENGEKTELANRYSMIYEELYIDEYQDTNRLQDDIFRAISNKNMFIVGDIKQSIYGFRGACPDIFSKYRKHGFSDGGKKVFLSENFRSDKKIISFSNGVFSSIMDGVSTVDYQKEDDLVYSKKDSGMDLDTDLILVKEDKERDISQASVVAGYIKRMIDGGTRPSDIAVLCRSMTASVTRLADECKKIGVPVSMGDGDEYFKRPWVLLLLCLLKTIDNRTKDIYMTGALRGELFGFDMNMLICMRNKYPSAENMWSCLVSYVEDMEKCGQEDGISVKGREFVDFVEEMRYLECDTSLDELVRNVIYQSRIIEACSIGKSEDEGDMIRRDILKLYSMACDCTSRGTMGLSSFLSYLDDVIENGTKEKGGNGKDSVGIITIHSSKGLQYPVCILYNADNTFRLSPDKDCPILFGEGIGFGMRLPDKNNVENKHDTLLSSSIRQLYAKNQREEEMRLLYVAFTRAENKLVVTAKCSDFQYDSPLTAHRALYVSSGSYLEWLRCCLGRVSPSSYNILTDLENYPIVSDDSGQAGDAYSVSMTAEEAARLENIEKHYKYQSICDIPTKANVSDLTPHYLDESGPDDQEKFEGDKEVCLPDFMTETIQDEGARRGTATHLFMQFCSYDNCRKYGVEYELARLVEKGFIDNESAKLVEIGGVNRFFSSSLFCEICAGRNVMREKRFNVKLDAALFTEDAVKLSTVQGEQLLVQGVIDCMFFDKNDRLVLVDYKTDRFSSNCSEGYISQILRERYYHQLKYYLSALDVIYPDVEKKAVIYSFALDNHIEMDI